MVGQVWPRVLGYTLFPYFPKLREVRHPGTHRPQTGPAAHQHLGLLGHREVPDEGVQADDPTNRRADDQGNRR